MTAYDMRLRTACAPLFRLRAGVPWPEGGGVADRERDGRRGQGELEAAVLAALHETPEPVSTAWVRERLGGSLAHTTVITILTRLLAKGAVARRKAGRSFVWTPQADEAGLAALRMRRILDGEDDRNAVLARFVTTLSPEDEAVLRALLECDGR